MKREMPKVNYCDVGICSYNNDSICHAMAVSVGGSSPNCNTFMNSTVKCNSNDIIGGVGACKEQDCKYNDCLLCTASSISVRLMNSKAMCDTFVM